MTVTYPEFSRAERLVDGVVHVLGLVLSAVAVAVLLIIVVGGGDPLSIVATSVYSLGLVAMLWFSASYNLTARPQRKELLRRLDHAAIYLMIAGTYTPFSLLALGGALGHGLLALVWSVAVAGMLVKLLHPRRFERSSVALYLVLGWIGLPVVILLIAALPPSTVVLLGLGGLLYTVGVVFHLWERLSFHNAVWHGFVLAAAACHYAAVLTVVA